MEPILSQDEIDTLLRNCLTANDNQNSKGDTCSSNEHSKMTIHRSAFAHSLDMLLNRLQRGENYYKEPAFVLWAVEYSDLADCPGCGEEINLKELVDNRCPLCGQPLQVDIYIT